MIPNLFVVVVNWNLKNDTLECIYSLVDAGISAKQIILVDNGSSDGSVQTFRETFGDNLHIIINSQNRGYATASNQGIQYGLEMGAEWILLLNNDTIIANDFFHHMSKASLLVEYSILAPIILYYSDGDRIWYLGDRLIPGTLITINPYRGKKFHDEYDDVVSLDFVSGCAMMVRREVFEKIGLFDNSLEMYGEEIDFCWRARNAGFRLAGIPKARVWHKISRSADRDQSRARYLRIRNQIRFYKRYAHGFQRPLMLFFTLLRSIGIGTIDLLNRRPMLISPLVSGWFDGWLG